MTSFTLTLIPDALQRMSASVLSSPFAPLCPTVFTPVGDLARVFLVRARIDLAAPAAVVQGLHPA